MYCSSIDVSQVTEGVGTTIPITIQPTSPSIVDLYDSKVRYYKNEEERGSPSQGYHSNEFKNDANREDIEEIKVVASEPICLGCTEARFSEEKMTFLCFTWKKKRKGVTYHTCQAPRAH